jgi:putative solute:sodium symporter small subunit
MNDSDNGYHISLFKPTTERARFNRNLIYWLASIWFVAIFGFQIALRVLQNPTPEPSYIAFENVWENVANDNASEMELQQLGASVLSVLGKVAIESDERVILDNALSHSLLLIYPDSMRAGLVSVISEFEVLKSGISDIGDERYIQEKKKLSKLLSPKLGLNALDVRTDVLPLELSTANINILSDETVNRLPLIMEKYLVHNQSFLTDARFLGFPFHYFYTAVFLLVLFVGLCLVYCLRIDRRNAILGIKE